jgi:hypothetical protein
VLPQDAPEPQTVQVTGRDVHVAYDLRHIGRYWLVFKQIPSQPFAYLHIIEQTVMERRLLSTRGAELSALPPRK